MSFFEELKRRNVFRVGVAYAIAAWVLLQVADLVLEAIEAPAWVLQALMLVVALGFIAAVVISWAYEMTPEGIKKEADVDRTQSITPETGHKLDRIIIGFLAVAVALLLLDRFVSTPEGQVEIASQEAPSTSEPVETELVMETPEKSIAVLPFANMSEDAGNEFFADGISEEILNALAKVQELKVAGRTSAFAFKGRNEDLRGIGEALGVNHILEGSVRKAGNKVRVTAQLIQVSDGFHLWSDTYDRELTDIFAIQDEIANAILQAMKAELLEGQSIASTQVDPAVYEKYLLAKQRSYDRHKPDLELAARLLEEATAADPGFAEAWAQRGIVTLLLAADAYGDIPHEEAQLTARPFLDRALEINPESADALAGMGLWYRNRPGGLENELQAIEVLKQALNINPSMIDASNWLQLAYANTGRDKESMAILEDMFRRDPMYKPGTGNLVWTYASVGRFDAANRLIDQIKPYVRDDSWVMRFEGNVLLMASQPGVAYPKLLKSFELEPQDGPAELSATWSMLALGMYEELAAMDVSIPFFRASALQRLGRTEEGLQFAREWTNRIGDPGLLIGHYFSTRQFETLVEHVNANWPDLQMLQDANTGLSGFGDNTMINLAYAYKKLGNMEKHRQAMSFVRAEHDKQHADDFGNAVFLHYAEARYHFTAGDSVKGLAAHEKALDMGGFFAPGAIRTDPVFDDYLHDEQFRALQQRGHEQFNAQRVLAGLEPLEAEFKL